MSYEITQNGYLITKAEDKHLKEVWFQDRNAVLLELGLSFSLSLL